MKEVEQHIFKTVVFLVFILAPFLCYCQTTLPTTINSDYILVKSNSPYRANGDVTVNSGVKLTVEPGVVIEFVENAGLYVKGRLVMEGESNDWIYLKTAPGNSDWDVVTLENTSGTSILRYVEITGSTHGKDSNRDRAALNAANVAKVILEHVKIYDVASCIYYNTTRDHCSFSNCYFKCNERGSVFFLVKSDVLIQDCEFAGVVGTNSDAIDFDKVTADIIGNTIYGMTGSDCDGIDMGSASAVYLKDNIILDCTDSGIEAEEGSVIVAEHNIISNCNIGVTVKENAIGAFTNNTFYNNETAFEAYSETNTGGWGGTITAKNNIISEYTNLYKSRDGSSLSFSYNLTEEGALAGYGNVSGNPMFKDVSNLDFNLESNSPAIDAGDPSSPLDPDGTIADIGAFYYDQGGESSGLIITEIHYYPLKNGFEDSDHEFIELYNRSEQEISIGDYTLEGAVKFTFPNGTIISPGEYVVICASTNQYSGIDAQVFAWSTGELSNNGDIIYLKNNSKVIILEITYSFLEPWPKRPLISNVSIELIGLDLLISQPGNWQHSLDDGGTPGKSNERSLLSNVYINEIVSKFGNSFADEYGNFSDWIEIYNANDFPIYLNGLYITDDLQDPQAFQFDKLEPDGLRLAGKGFLVLFADANSDLGIRHLNFQLRSAGEVISIGQSNRDEYFNIDEVEFGPLLRDQSYGRSPDGAANFQIFDLPTPGAPNESGSTDKYFDLKINELVAKYDNSYPDEHGFHSDWIEIYNSGSKKVNLAGLYFSDRSSDPKVHRIPVNIGDSAVIESGEFIVFRPDAKPELGYNHLDFQLASSGEEVILSVEISGELHVIDQKAYPPQVQGKSYGRLGDGSKWWVFFGNPTPGAPNGTTAVEHVISDQLDLLVYPNPAKDILTVLLAGETSYIELVEVFDMQGGKWKTWYKEDLKTPLKLELHTKNEGIPSGIYVIRLTGSGKSITRRFIIQ